MRTTIAVVAIRFRVIILSSANSRAGDPAGILLLQGSGIDPMRRPAFTSSLGEHYSKLRYDDASEDVQAF